MKFLLYYPPPALFVNTMPPLKNKKLSFLFLLLLSMFLLNISAFYDRI